MPKYLTNFGTRADPAEVYSAYMSVHAGGSINPLVEAVLPYAVGMVYKKYSSVDDDVCDEIMAELAAYLIPYMSKISKMEFSSGLAILSYISQRLRGMSAEYWKQSQHSDDDFDVRQIPLMYIPSMPDKMLEDNERIEHIRNFTVNNIRLSGIRKNHVMMLINDGVNSLNGILKPDMIKFITDYVAVLARIADREYMEQ